MFYFPATHDLVGVYRKPDKPPDFMSRDYEAITAIVPNVEEELLNIVRQKIPWPSYYRRMQMLGLR